ncbi:MAG: hypothetical protein ACOCRX_03500 [Candidatus Woesearchaeota archaeon]
MKFKSVVFILIVSFLLIGCELENPEEDEQMGFGSSYIGGSDGLSVEFMENQPPSTILDDSQSTFSISLQVKNEGEYDIPSGGVTTKIEGIDSRALGRDDLTASLDSNLRGKRLISGDQENPGDIGYITLDDLSYQDSVSTNIPLNLRARVCYDYQTNAIVNGFCIKKDPLDISDSSCEVSGSKTVDSSSAPISVRNFEQRPISNNEIRLSFDVVHQSNGEIISPSTDDCFDTERAQKNRVNVRIVGASNNLECSEFESSNGDLIREDINLYGGDRYSVRCTYNTDDASQRGTEDTVQIVLEYKYRTSNEKTIMLRDSGN